MQQTIPLFVGVVGNKMIVHLPIIENVAGDSLLQVILCIIHGDLTRPLRPKYDLMKNRSGWI